MPEDSASFDDKYMMIRVGTHDQTPVPKHLKTLAYLSSILGFRV